MMFIYMFIFIQIVRSLLELELSGSPPSHGASERAAGGTGGRSQGGGRRPRLGRFLRIS